MHRNQPPFAVIAATALAMAAPGCLDVLPGSDDDQPTLADLGFEAPADADAPLAASDVTWPDFSGKTLRILDHGAFDFAFAEAAPIFENLTGARVEQVSAADTGDALNRAIQDRGDPQSDILYGVDNILLTRAVDAGIYEPYTPVLAPRVQDPYVFFGDQDPWPATPVDHGYIALNVDADHEGLDGGNVTIEDLFDVRDHADLFVTQDPRRSTPGLGFLLITIGVFGEGTPYDWQDYWQDLFQGGVKITHDWTTAYVTHFSQGYGIHSEGHIGDRPIVTSYTESPAVEVYFESFSPEERAEVLLEHNGAPAVFHQVQTMGILRGTSELALAQAWIEFTLTDDFQALAAPQSAVYPVVATMDADDVYGDLDPQPGTFAVVDMDWQTIGGRLEDWVGAWTDLCQAHGCA